MATISRETAYCLLPAVCCLLVLFSGCGQPKQPLKESAIAMPEPTMQPQDRSASKPIDTPPPRPSEIREVIQRVYQRSVTVYAKRNGHFIAGDFNGDRSQDIAVIVKPGEGKLADLNSEVANWTIQDAQNVSIHVTKTLSRPTPPAPTKVKPNDLLLAVIHGYGSTGWRAPQARQTYLVRNAVGIDLEAQPLTTVLNNAADKRKLPRLRGDVVMEKMAGQTGILYWTGAKYAWYRLTAPGS
jgi:hypothetical protein